MTQVETLETATTAPKTAKASVKTPASPLQVYFQKFARLGNYSILHLTLPTSTEKMQIVVEQDIEWIETSLKKFFKQEVKDLSLEQIYDFMLQFSRKLRLSTLSDRLGLGGQENENPNAFAKLFYFDDYAKGIPRQSIAFSIIAQILFERFTRLETRIVPLTCLKSATPQRVYALAVQNPIVRSQFFLFDPTGENSGLHKQDIDSVVGDKFMLHLEDLQVSHPPSVWNDKNKSITLIGDNGRQLDFTISGRTPTEKRFAREEEIIKNAGPNDLVPMEIYFLPYYRPLGHTAVRIGGSLYELQMKGWKAHADGTNSPRAFLFNNPFFRSQYAMLKKFGMPPISMGKTIYVEKHKVERLNIILENQVAAKGKAKQKFNILTNNCNQGITRALAQADIGRFETNGYMGFSSVLTFRRFLLESDFPNEKLHIYPLPNMQISEPLLRQWIPQLIYRHNSVRREIIRAFPRYFHNIAYANVMFVRRKIVGLFKVENKEEAL